MKAASGYIMIMTLLITSIAAIAATYIFYQGSIFVPYADTMIKREKALMLALAGIEIAKSELAQGKIEKKGEESTEKKEGNDEQKKKLTPDQELQAMLGYWIPLLNRWQFFSLNEKRDGIEGKIAIAVSSEEGKIPLNQIYDFEKHSFVGEKQAKGDWKKIIQNLFKNLPKNAPQGLFEALEKYLKDRLSSPRDLTELLKIPEFSFFKNAVFRSSPEQAEKQPKPGEKKEKIEPEIYLTDIFSLHTENKAINPWFFSQSIKQLLGISLDEDLKNSANQKIVDSIVKNAKKSAQWASDWNSLLKPLYAKELRALPEGIESILDTTWRATYFTVYSYATVGKTEQRVCAVVERKQTLHKDKTVYDITVKKLYRL